MTEELQHDPARDPQDLERLLVSRERAGNVDGMVALYERHAVIDLGEGRLIVGKEAIRSFFAEVIGTGRKFEFGEQRRGSRERRPGAYFNEVSEWKCDC